MSSVSPSFKLRDSGICIGPSAKAELLSQLRKDLSLLVECSVMDYSLLVGVVKKGLSFGEASSIENAKREIEEKLLSGGITKKHFEGELLSTLSRPIRHLVAPVMYLAQTVYNAFLELHSIALIHPFPYYGAGTCGVNGGTLSVLQGRRLGKGAIYYIGVIDFLQPWSTQKILEREFKGVMGFDKNTISCTDPKRYADRFLNFMDKHIT